MTKGMPINRIIQRKEKILSYIGENVLYDGNLNIYTEKFNKSLNSGIIMGGSFYEDIWAIKCKEYVRKVVFNFGFKKELNNALKCYFLILINDKVVMPDSAVSDLNMLKSICLQSYFFNKKFIEVIIQKISNYSNSIVKIRVLEFLSFYPIGNYQEYIEKLSNISFAKKQRVRKLPDYRSILIFAEILEMYIEECCLEEKIKYSAIYIWFKITQIIPMRTIEFRKLKADCCYFDDKRNSYFIKLKRSKATLGSVKSKYDLQILPELKVSKDIFEIINEYRKLVDPEFKAKYLVPYSLYASYFREKKRPRTSFLAEGRISQIMLSKMINDFYTLIIKDKYQYRVIHKSDSEFGMDDNAIEILTPMDTRHLAFCNMLLMGYNPLTIAQMGGHTNIESQNAYFSHIGIFLETQTMLLARKMLSVNGESNWVKNGMTSQEIFVKNYIRNGKPYRLVESNRFLCYSENFPYECADSSCNFCRYSKLNEEAVSFEDYYQELLKESKSIQTQIKVQRDILEKCYKDIQKNGSISLASNTCNGNAQEQLKYESGKLCSLSYRMAEVEARINEILKEYATYGKTEG